MNPTLSLCRREKEKEKMEETQFPNSFNLALKKKERKKKKKKEEERRNQFSDFESCWSCLFCCC